MKPRTANPGSPGGADAELYYHYNREERLARRPDHYEAPKGGIFKRNRSLAIILLDVMVILLIFLIFRTFVFGGGADAPELQGYRLDMRLLETSQGVLALVTIRAPEEVEETSGIVEVSFSPGDGAPADAGSSEVGDLLPEPGEVRRISELFPAGTTQVDAVVSIDDKRLDLEAEIEDS
jgi:hypothetical protein